MRRVISIFVLASLMPCASVAQGLKAYTVAGSSMSPTLEPGDTVVVEEAQGAEVRRGELVAIGFSGRPGLMVKRVAAAPGDRVQVLDGELIVNGEPHEPRSFIDPNRWRPMLIQLERFGWTIPGDMVFVLGDNQVNSRDSRRLGLISVKQIKGRIVSVNHIEKEGADED